jgi:hypothetical protein
MAELYEKLKCTLWAECRILECLKLVTQINQPLGFESLIYITQASSTLATTFELDIL